MKIINKLVILYNLLNITHGLVIPKIGYIYIIKEREFINSNTNIYKIGRTQNILERVKNYPKNSKLHYTIFVNDVVNTETKLIKLFICHFNHRKDIGREYFEGDVKQMIDIIHNNTKDLVDIY